MWRFSFFLRLETFAPLPVPSNPGEVRRSHRRWRTGRLSAALVLGRCCRKVLIVDAGNPRNMRSHGVHGFLTREGLRPAELLAMARDQLSALRCGVSRRYGHGNRPHRGRVSCHVCSMDRRVESRKVLLATGVVDLLPDLEGIEEMYGVSVHHCPYCDGWEHRDGRIAVYGAGKSGGGLALAMKTWSRDVVMCSDGPSRLSGRIAGKAAAQRDRRLRKKDQSPGRNARQVGAHRLRRWNQPASHGNVFQHRKFAAIQVYRSPSAAS